jgi:hypothetical protein
MIWRMTVGIVFLLLAVEEFVRAGSVAAEIVTHPGELVSALLSGDGSVGPWLLLAYGVLMLARGWAHRPLAAASDPPAGGAAGRRPRR